jgi:hypothetical protein
MEKWDQNVQKNPQEHEYWVHVHYTSETKLFGVLTVIMGWQRELDPLRREMMGYILSINDEHANAFDGLDHTHEGTNEWRGLQLTSPDVLR